MNDLTRRRFIERAAVVSAGTYLTAATATSARATEPIRCRGYAAFDTTGELRPYEFERRPVGDNDILIDIKFASICHSDIHQERGDWGPQRYPQIPGHEIVGIVAAVGAKVTRFKVGDRAGVGCMLDSCMRCEHCSHGEEHHCDKGQTLFTYGALDKREPTGITQGGYSTNIVVRDHFAVHIPEHIALHEAAPLLCAGITTYSPIVQARLDVGARVGVAGIGGLGHLAVKLAASRGAEVTAFTTSVGKVADLRSFGARNVVVVDAPEQLAAHRASLDWMISTIPVTYNLAAYAATVKPHGSFTQVGMPNGFALNVDLLALSLSRVNFNVSLIGGMRETQDVVRYCADHDIRPQVQVIAASDINDAWRRVQRKEARYRYVIDAATFQSHAARR